MPPRIPDEKRAAILDDIRGGGTCRGIARAHDVSTDTVRRIAAEGEVTDAFARANTKKATEAKQADNRAARAQLSTEALDMAREMMRRGHDPKNGHDAQGWATAFGIYADKHLVLERADATDGADHVASMLGKLGDALQVAADQLDAGEVPADEEGSDDGS